MSSVPETSDPMPPSGGDRREFIKCAACCLLGTAAVAAPGAAGVVVLLGPLGKPAPDGAWVNLTKIDALAMGGEPRLFQVFVERTDAWTRHARSAVGSVFLERTGEHEVRAFHAACPHLGCSVEWRKEKSDYFCPCHDSAFSREGSVVGKSPSARGLDTLVVELRGQGEVWVRFQDFKAGVKEKIPVA